MEYVYTKVRETFGSQPLFCDRGPELVDSICVDMAIRKQYVLRNPVHQSTQFGPCFSEHEMNTIRPELKDTGVEHSEGGWAKEIHPNDIEQTMRYRRKIEKDENYVRSVEKLFPGIQYIVSQNNAINMYNVYFHELPMMPPLDHTDIRIVNIFKEPHNRERPVSSINWSHDGHKFAAAYADVDFDRNPKQNLHAYLWNIEHCDVPEASFVPKSSLLDIKFSPRDEHVLAAGLINGQVCAFDLRAGKYPSAICEPHVSHRDLVSRVLFFNSKTGLEFFSGSTDGSCKWWDIRNMSAYTDKMIIEYVKSPLEVPSMATSLSVCEMEYETTLPTRFMVGTENGRVICGNRKGKTSTEKLPAQYFAHNGPIRALERNPHSLKNFLTAGDWTMRIWSEDCKESAVMFTKPSRYKINHAVWSPTRISVFLATLGNGQLACWDLLRNQNHPVFTVQACHEPLLCVQYNDMGVLAACGSQKGKVYMMELSHNLTACEKNDKMYFAQILERESRRERILEARLREIKLKHRQAMGTGSPKESTTDLTQHDRDLTEATNEYMSIVKNS